MNKLLIALLALVGMTACTTETMAKAPGSAAQDIERFVQQTVKTVPALPGVGIAVVRDGRTVYVGGAGFRDRERKIPVDAQSAYYIGSTTKAYTGLACAILAQRGVLDLDAPINKYLPELKTQSASLRTFLTHSASIENGGIVFRTAYTGEHNPAQLISLLDSSKPRDPGFRYDNLGYVVASLVIERVTGRPWQKVLDELVFTPLGMDHTSAYMSEASRWPMAVPYQLTRKGEIAPLAFMKNDQMMHAAGGIVTTPADLARWMQAQVANGRVEGRQRVPAAAVAEAQKQQVPVSTPNNRSAFTREGYGFGWFQGKFEGHAILSHGGGFSGWQSVYSFLPAEKIGVGVMTNANGTTAAMELISSYVYERLLEKPDVETRYAEKLEKLRDDVEKARANAIANFEKIAARPWMLQHPNAAYVGRYDNPLYGTLSIQERDGKLWASLGPLSSVIEAFTDPESARAELVPGSGEVLRFSFTTSDKPDSVKWGEDEFRRVN